MATRTMAVDSAKPITKPGMIFPENDLQWTKGSDQKLVEGSVLPLPGHRKGRHQKRDYQGEKSHDPRNDEPSAFKIGIVPGPKFDRGDWGREPVKGGKIVVVPWTMV